MSVWHGVLEGRPCQQISFPGDLYMHDEEHVCSVTCETERVLRWFSRAVVNILKCFPYVSQEERVHHQMEVLQELL